MKPGNEKKTRKRRDLLSLRRLATLSGSKPLDIKVRTREDEALIDEVVAGENLMRLFYGTPAGLRLTSTLFVRRWLSYFGGLYYDLPLSKRKIKKFVKQLDIDVDEAEKDMRDYRSFNEFFARRLRPGSRPVDPDPRTLVSPGDGRITVFPNIDDTTISYVKWAPIRLIDLFNRDRELVERYRGGSCGVLRLCPSDYHRFHFPASGLVGETKKVKGLLHSVSPYILGQKNRPVFALNKRTICELKTQEFGTILLMEIGAIGVGSILQSHQPGTEVQRGDEKGYFKFGGSTTLFFLEKDRALFDDDLVRNSRDGLETLVRMGERIAVAPYATDAEPTPESPRPGC